MVSLAILPFAHPSTCTIILQGGTKTHIPSLRAGTRHIFLSIESSCPRKSQ